MHARLRVNHVFVFVMAVAIYLLLNYYTIVNPLHHNFVLALVYVIQPYLRSMFINFLPLFHSLIQRDVDSANALKRPSGESASDQPPKQCRRTDSRDQAGSSGVTKSVVSDPTVAR